MVNEKNKLIKRIKEIQKRLYKSGEGGYLAESNNLLDLLYGNPYTCKIIVDLKNKYPNVLWNPYEWEHFHIHDGTDIEQHEDKYEPSRPDEKAIAGIILIEHVVDGWSSVETLCQFVDGRYAQRYKHFTERFVDPIVNYLCDTIVVDEHEEPDRHSQRKDEFKPMSFRHAFLKKIVDDNINSHPIVVEGERDIRNFDHYQKNSMMARQDYKCGCCGKYIDSLTSEADHKVSWERGGFTDMDNGWMLCLDCHKLKTQLEGACGKEKKRKSKHHNQTNSPDVN